METEKRERECQGQSKKILRPIEPSHFEGTENKEGRQRRKECFH